MFSAGCCYFYPVLIVVVFKFLFGTFMVALLILVKCLECILAAVPAVLRAAWCHSVRMAELSTCSGLLLLTWSMLLFCAERAMQAPCLQCPSPHWSRRGLQPSGGKGGNLFQATGEISGQFFVGLCLACAELKPLSAL